MAHHHIGKAYLNYKCYEQAIDHLTLALKKNSKLAQIKQTKLYHTYVLRGLSKCYYEISSFEDALEVLSKAEDIQETYYKESKPAPMQTRPKRERSATSRRSSSSPTVTPSSRTTRKRTATSRRRWTTAAGPRARSPRSTPSSRSTRPRPTARRRTTRRPFSCSTSPYVTPSTRRDADRPQLPQQDGAGGSIRPAGWLLREERRRRAADRDPLRQVIAVHRVVRRLAQEHLEAEAQHRDGADEERQAGRGHQDVGIDTSSFGIT